MKRLNTFLLYAVFLLANLFVARAPAQVDWPQLKLTQIASGLIAPVHVNSARDGSERLFVVEQEGRIRIVQSNSLIPAPFLDITERVSSPLNSLYGLLSVAFPTNYTAKGYFYVYYSRTNDQASVISRFFVSTNANRADPLTEQVVLVISNAECVTLLGGLVAFGPDGYLYISAGSDELCADQPESQRPDSLWGKILRIDVESGTNAYRVPSNNPFVNNPAYRPEIWALGFRNPWRFSFDRQTGDLYIGDVGQNEWEEIDFQSAASAGGQNYGWPAREGNHPFDDLPEVDPDLLTPPIVEYPHTNLAPSAVTAGFVYRGPNSPRMNGLYFFGDFYLKQVWAVAHSGVNWQMQTIPIPKHFISSFGEDESGQFYFADLLFGTVNRVEDSGLAGAPIFTPSVSNSPSDVITGE